MANLIELVRVNSKGFILLIFAFVPIQTPVCPVQIVLLHQSHQIFPRYVLTIVAEFPQQKWRSIIQSSDIQLKVEKLCLKPFVWNHRPYCCQPWKTIKVTRVYKFIRYMELNRVMNHIRKVQLWIYSTNKYQPMRSYF